MQDETYPDFGGLLQRDIDWLRACGVPMGAIIRPQPIRRSHGFRAADGRFEIDANGPVWLTFIEPEDVIFWRPKTSELATWTGRSFALGEAVIGNAATFSFGNALHLYASPLDWLRAGRDGTVVLDWRHAFDRLRECPRIAVDDRLLPIYRRHMRPARMPDVFLLEAAQQRNHRRSA
ncbi:MULTISPECIES: hypothetical protein [Rhizobium]|uniref:hypothetical protein n=1 Tax=Rhizobium TaxID=379 RepID=UPI0010325555|nr:MULTISPECIES: hypothetical protein [Rhizobium]TAX50981.1 hypothetical protein ELH99_12930 [Rhizobium leguminosarum]TBE06453.1 hypothetical protein ELH12_10805 [Rhizobium ruizarguesonis]